MVLLHIGNIGDASVLIALKPPLEDKSWYDRTYKTEHYERSPYINLFRSKRQLMKKVWPQYEPGYTIDHWRLIPDHAYTIFMRWIATSVD